MKLNFCDFYGLSFSFPLNFVRNNSYFQLPDNLPVRLSADVDQNTDGTLTGVEGRLGELQIRKSGAVQLVLGGRSSTGAATSQGNGTGEGQKKLVQKFDVEVGTQVGFLQVHYLVYCQEMKTQMSPS